MFPPDADKKHEPGTLQARKLLDYPSRKLKQDDCGRPPFVSGDD
ncbi:Protein of unknown function [Pyronema omphalodes CBS 100304]|uniref:Uncharacterized protein n=1 Tax=Pyronema omphalodes (strain CBS 100304) TaxID=1076935 RepID=U4LUM1_PYROM|nr:Protein of unknown function [Pyronema omphalodes CBS 100304]